MKKQSEDREPTDAFALMEDSFAADLCFFVEHSLNAVKKVLSRCAPSTRAP